MTPERWNQVEEFFQAALTQPTEARAAFLDAACGDPELREEVTSLLEAADREGPVDRLAGALASPLAAARDAVPDPPYEPGAGHQVGPYRIVREIGRGGMGTVYLAERADGQFEQRVALKLARAGLGSEGLQLRFLDERRALARLQHPGIARLLGGGLTGGERPYFAMEFVEGEHLDRYCDDRRLDLTQRLRLFGQVCEAVHHAHQHLVVHRDLKPSNILVPAEGPPRVKLLDFGIAKLLEEEGSEPLTRPTTRVLTPEYAAPEQIRGEPVSTAADVYSLGVVLYELLTGRRPYELRTLSPGEMERVICEAEPPSPSTVVTRSPVPSDGGHTVPAAPEAIGRARSTAPDTLARQLAGDLDTIVLKALAKEPARRYASAEALVEDIKRYLDGLPVQARPASTGYRLRKFVDRHRVGVLASALAGAALLAALATMTELARSTTAERDRAQAEAAKAEQVSTFLQNILSPMHAFEFGIPAGDSTLTVAEVVRRAAASAPTELADHPEVLATVHRTLGDAFFEIGLLSEAEAHLRAALALRDSLFAGEPHPDRIQSLEDLSQILTMHPGPLYTHADSLQRLVIRWTAADSLARTALRLRRHHAGPQSPRLIKNYLDLYARTPFALRGPETTALLDEAYGIWSTSPEASLEMGHDLRSQIAIDHLESRRFAAADSAFAALAKDLSHYAVPDDLRRAHLYHTWGAVHVLTGDFNRAESHIDTALAILERRLPEGHINLVMARGLRAPILLHRRQFAEAEALLRPTRDTLLKAAPALWANNIAAVLLGAALAGRGRDAEAESLLVEGLRYQRNALGDRHHWIPYLASHLVAFYDARGRPHEADPYRPLLDTRPHEKAPIVSD